MKKIIFIFIFFYSFCLYSDENNIKSSYFGINGAMSVPLIKIEGTKTNNGDNFSTTLSAPGFGFGLNFLNIFSENFGFFIDTDVLSSFSSTTQEDMVMGGLAVLVNVKSGFAILQNFESNKPTLYIKLGVSYLFLIGSCNNLGGAFELGFKTINNTSISNFFVVYNHFFYIHNIDDEEKIFKNESNFGLLSMGYRYFF